MKLAIVRVRGMIGLRKEIKDTFKMLNLNKKNHCIILENNPSNLGMIKKVKDFVTWGVIDEETLKLVESKRKEINKKGEKVKQKFISLNPPKKGYGRKGIKAPFNISGALGNRKEKINDLLKRMIH